LGVCAGVVWVGGFFVGGLFCLGGGEVGFAEGKRLICVSLLDPPRFYLDPNRILIGSKYDLGLL